MNNCSSCKELLPENAHFCPNCGLPTADGPGAPQARKILAHLVVDRGDGAGSMFQLGESEVLIGRWDADNGIFPEIDLDPHDPDSKVSRRHAKVRFKEGKFFVEDLGSTNGTFLNRSRRLIPGMPQALADDDEVIVGKTFLRFKVVAA